MRVRYRVSPYAAAGLLTELGGEAELRVGDSPGPLERECALEELRGLLGAGRLEGDTLVDLGQGWERADGCAALAGACRGRSRAPGWVPYALAGGLLVLGALAGLMLR